MVIAVAGLAAFFQVLGEVCTQASNSLVTGRGEGWGYSLFLWVPEGRHGQGGLFPGPSLFLLCTCTGWAKATISKLSLRSRLKAKYPWTPRQISRRSSRPQSRRLRASRS